VSANAAAASAEWVQALPIGNGRLGAMVFGGVVNERLQLNESTLWAGGPYDPANPEARTALPEVRRLIFDRKYEEAARLVTDKMLARPIRQMPYQPLGDLWLTFPAVERVSDYRRSLNLENAIAATTYEAGGVRFTREVFSSAADNVIVVRLTASARGQISFRARMTTPQQAVVTATANEIVVGGVNADGAGTTADGRPIPHALKFQARLRVVTESGTIRIDDTPRTNRTDDRVSPSIVVDRADAVTLLVAGATSYRSFKDTSEDPATATSRSLDNASKKTPKQLHDAHVADYRQLFGRVALNLGTTLEARRPTDERIRTFATGDDPQLAALYYQFGRYLLISSSRPGGQPANLQGLWNDSMKPPWESKYTININTEMNYWPAEPTNLAESVEPLIAMVADLSETGARTARTMYGANGWVVHHNTDLWRATAPIDQANSGMWPTGGAWLSLHLWEHYLFGADRTFLAKAYPLMKGAAQFFLDTLVEEPAHHWLVTSPSLSPENRHPFGTAVVAGPTMDEQILRELFGCVIQASQLLGVDDDFRATVSAARARLAPNQIGGAGQLQEWLEDWDLKASDMHHRHVSHLFGLFPGNEITLRDTPELAAAVRKSLELRGDQATGWATAWRINLWAHLHDGNHAYEIFKFLLGPERTYPDMFDAHPPFQIDGNFGGTSGMTEMLMQSRALPPDTRGSSIFEIEVLPALPTAWPNGSVTGLRARGGFDVDVRWAAGKPTLVIVRSLAGNRLKLRIGETTRDLNLKRGAAFQWPQ
jgi:alpha-L-fucosidase 2